MEHKNSLNKVNEKHKVFGNLKEDRLLKISEKKDDLTEIIENVNKYLAMIEDEKYKYTLDEFCDLLEITKRYANDYFIDKLDTLYITRTCKLFIYAIKSKDTKQIKDFSKLFVSDDRFLVCTHICFKNNEKFRERLNKLNLTKERLLKKYFISEASIKRAIKEVFKNEIRTRDYDGEIIQTEYIDINDALVEEILELGLITTNTLKAELDINTDTQLHRVLRDFKQLEELRIAVVNNSDNKYNTIRYINNKDIIENVKFTLYAEQKANEEFAKERYKRERNSYKKV